MAYLACVAICVLRLHPATLAKDVLSSPVTHTGETNTWPVEWAPANWLLPDATHMVRLHRDLR